MSKRKQRFIAAMLLCVMVLLCACSGGSKNANTASGDINLDGFPLVKDKAEISVWIPMNSTHATAGVTKIEDLASVKALEELTNVKVNWEAASATDKDTLYQLMIASGDIPDAFLWHGTQVSTVIRSGVVENLSGYMDTYGKNYINAISQVPGLKEAVSDDNGDMWGMFSYYPDKNLTSIWSFPLIRADWLKKLGKEMPNNQDEWLDVLRAIKTGDPNGNGIADEIPFSIRGIDRVAAILFWPLGMSSGFYVEDGTVKYGFVEDKCKDALAYGKLLYDEELLDREFLVQDAKTLERKFLSNIAGSGAESPHKYMNEVVEQMVKTVPDYDMQIAGYMQCPDNGNRYSFEGGLDTLTSTYAFYVSNTSKNKELTIRWIDSLFTEKGGLAANFGVEGETYDMVDGEPVFKKDLLMSNGVLNCTNRAAYTFGGDGSYGNGFPAYYEKPRCEDGKWKPSDVTMVFGSDEVFGKVYEARQMIDSSRMYPEEPAVKLTVEESDELAQIMTDINIFTEEAMSQIVTGIKPLEYLEEAVSKVKSLNIDRAIEIKQAAYDRFRSK